MSLLRDNVLRPERPSGLRECRQSQPRALGQGQPGSSHIPIATGRRLPGFLAAGRREKDRSGRDRRLRWRWLAADCTIGWHCRETPARSWRGTWPQRRRPIINGWLMREATMQSGAAQCTRSPTISAGKAIERSTHRPRSGLCILARATRSDGTSLRWCAHKCRWQGRGTSQSALLLGYGSGALRAPACWRWRFLSLLSSKKPS